LTLRVIGLLQYGHHLLWPMLFCRHDLQNVWPHSRMSGWRLWVLKRLAHMPHSKAIMSGAGPGRAPSAVWVSPAACQKAPLRMTDRRNAASSDADSLPSAKLQCHSSVLGKWIVEVCALLIQASPSPQFQAKTFTFQNCQACVKYSSQQWLCTVVASFASVIHVLVSRCDQVASASKYGT
jgi:hypothetical protein